MSEVISLLQARRLYGRNIQGNPVSRHLTLIVPFPAKVRTDLLAPNLAARRNLDCHALDRRRFAGRVDPVPNVTLTNGRSEAPGESGLATNKMSSERDSGVQDRPCHGRDNTILPVEVNKSLCLPPTIAPVAWYS